MTSTGPPPSPGPPAAATPRSPTSSSATAPLDPTPSTSQPAATLDGIRQPSRFSELIACHREPIIRTLLTPMTLIQTDSRYAPVPITRRADLR